MDSEKGQAPFELDTAPGAEQTEEMAGCAEATQARCEVVCRLDQVAVPASVTFPASILAPVSVPVHASVFATAPCSLSAAVCRIA